MIQIAAYQGTSFISKLIRWQTRSQYSHIAIRFMDDLVVQPSNRHKRPVVIRSGNVIEAWKGGVRLAASMSFAHNPRTKVDLFEFIVPLTPVEELQIARFLVDQIGHGYDYLSIFHFLTREPELRWSRNRWFCSELAFASLTHAGVFLLERVEAWKVPPSWIPMSSLLRFAGSEWTV